MLLQNSVLENLVIGSVRSGARIGRVSGLVINPHNLHIDAFWCHVLNMGKMLLMPIDILEISPMGIVINDHDVLMNEADAIRLKPILEKNYRLSGKQALVGRRKVGVVSSFSVESDSLFIRKLHVQPSLLRRFKSSQLTFDRQSIREVNNRAVIFDDQDKVKDMSKQKIPSSAQVSANA